MAATTLPNPWGANMNTNTKGKRLRRVLVGSGVLVATVAGGLGVANRMASGYQRYAITMDSVALRSGPGTQYQLLQRVNHGTPIDVDCQVQGGTNVGGNATWDRLTGGQWVSDYYTNTPSF